MNSAIDQIVTEVSRKFVRQLGALNADPYIREAVMKRAIREVSWAMLEIFGDQYAWLNSSNLWANSSKNIKMMKPEYHLRLTLHQHPTCFETRPKGNTVQIRHAPTTYSMH
jgi:hypothetical protein